MFTWRPPGTKLSSRGTTQNTSSHQAIETQALCSTIIIYRCWTRLNEKRSTGTQRYIEIQTNMSDLLVIDSTSGTTWSNGEQSSELIKIWMVGKESKWSGPETCCVLLGPLTSQETSQNG